MAKKGRPFTYQNDEEKPVTISLRLPKELHTRLERYATQHRQSISELMRDGLEWRIGEGDPRGTGLYLDQPTGIREQVYNSNTEIGQGAQEAEALQEVRTLLRQQWEQIQALAQALERQKVLPSDDVYSSNTTMPATDVAISYQEASYTEVVTLTDERIPESAIPATVPPYDASKYHLGKLCPSQDAWGTTGQSLRNADNQCLACKARAKRGKRAQQRQAAAL